jgi:hypothetical protein
MLTVLPDDYETSIHINACKGDIDNWHPWKIKTRTIATKKERVEALDANYSYDGNSTL